MMGKKDKVKNNESKPAEKSDQVYNLRLYVAGQTPKSLAAFANLKAICEENLQNKYTIWLVTYAIYHRTVRESPAQSSCIEMI